MDRLKSLKRLWAVYGLVEEIHSVEARVAAAEVGEAEAAMQAEGQAIREARLREREAMRSDDPLGRLTVTAQETMASRRRLKLEPLLAKRREVSDAARMRHVASRLWSERMKSMVEDESARIADVEARRLQAVSDDRFLSRSGVKKKTDAEER